MQFSNWQAYMIDSGQGCVTDSALIGRRGCLTGVLTPDGYVFAVAVLLPGAPVLHFADVVSLVVQLDVRDAQLQHPAVSGAVEG